MFISGKHQRNRNAQHVLQRQLPVSDTREELVNYNNGISKGAHEDKF